MRAPGHNAKAGAHLGSSAAWVLGVLVRGQIGDMFVERFVALIEIERH
jgi:hypothetical protein